MARIILLISLLITNYALFSENNIKDEYFNNIDSTLELLQYEITKENLDKIPLQDTFKNPLIRIHWHIKYSDYYYRLKNHYKSYQYLSKAEELCDRYKNKILLPNIKIKQAINIGVLGDLNMQIKLINQAYKIAENNKDSFEIICIEYTKFIIDDNNLDSILKNVNARNIYLSQYNYYVQEFEKYKKNHPKEYLRVLFNRALFYSNINLDSSIYLFKNIVKLCIENNRTVTLCNAFSCIGENYFLKNNIVLAEYYILKSLVIANKIGDYEVNIKNYTFLSKIYTIKKKYQMALYYTNQLISLKTTMEKRYLRSQNLIPNQIKKNDIQLIKIKQLELERHILRERQKSNRILLISFVCICSLIILYLVLFANYLKRKQKLNEAFKDKEISKLIIQQLELEKKQNDREFKARIEGYENAQEFIARELHDQVANSIGAIKLKIETIFIKNNISNHSNKVLEQLDNTYKKVRNLSHNLYIFQEYETDIIELIKDFSQEFWESYNINVSYSVYPENCLNKLLPEVKKELYLIVREIFINIKKYANATEINLNINEYQGKYVILLMDNGVGIDLNELEFSNKGLKNIEWRLHKIQGTIQVHSNNKSGTQIAIHF